MHFVEWLCAFGKSSSDDEHKQLLEGPSQASYSGNAQSWVEAEPLSGRHFPPPDIILSAPGRRSRPFEFLSTLIPGPWTSTCHAQASSSGSLTQCYASSGRAPSIIEQAESRRQWRLADAERKEAQSRIHRIITEQYGNRMHKVERGVGRSQPVSGLFKSHATHANGPPSRSPSIANSPFAHDDSHSLGDHGHEHESPGVAGLLYIPAGHDQALVYHTPVDHINMPCPKPMTQSIPTESLQSLSRSTLLSCTPSTREPPAQPLAILSPILGYKPLSTSPQPTPVPLSERGRRGAMHVNRDDVSRSVAHMLFNFGQTATPRAASVFSQAAPTLGHATPPSLGIESAPPVAPIAQPTESLHDMGELHLTSDTSCEASPAPSIAEPRGRQAGRGARRGSPPSSSSRLLCRSHDLLPAEEKHHPVGGAEDDEGLGVVYKEIGLHGLPGLVSPRLRRGGHRRQRSARGVAYFDVEKSV